MVTDSERDTGLMFTGEIVPVEGMEIGEIATNPFPLGGGIVACRIEHRDSNWLNRIHNSPGPYNPHSRFFREQESILVPPEGAPTFVGLEDPFGTWIKDEKGQKQLLFGGVEVDFKAKGGPEIVTKLFLAPEVAQLSPNKLIATVRGMRDIRLAQLEGEDIAMLTRPTTGEAYPGSIGFTRLTLEEIRNTRLFQEKIDSAKLLHFSLSGMRLGANAAYSEQVMLPSGETKELLHVVCHSSEADPYINDAGEVIKDDFVNGKIHYKAYDFYLDPENITGSIQLRLLAQSSDFPQNPEHFKGERYGDVVFPGGIAGTTLYLGLGDRSVGRKKIPISA